MDQKTFHPDYAPTRTQPTVREAAPRRTPGGRFVPWEPHVYDTRPQSTAAKASLTAAIVGVLAGWCLLGLPCIAAIVLGHVGLIQTKGNAMRGRKQAVAGMVIGYVTLVPTMLLCLAMTAVLIDGVPNQ